MTREGFASLRRRYKATFVPGTTRYVDAKGLEAQLSLGRPLRYRSPFNQEYGPAQLHKIRPAQDYRIGPFDLGSRVGSKPDILISDRTIFIIRSLRRCQGSKGPIIIGPASPA
ncbi:hypothetical protein B296_00049594 [Ensete ventricosum]|uniref:Uncharacterized protein n=1 Tax=Ensete ventricosum TaxID=4639 RepID=A0A426X4R1_ENSVE|nr:hypothetical protein B296_00049594 [Ensete ventricosum]